MTNKARGSRRVTNPLDPTYAIWDEQLGEFGKKPDSRAPINNSYGGIAGSKPTGLPKAVRGIRNLATGDINGAQAGTTNKGAFFGIERRQVRPCNKIEDIPGSQADTYKRGFQGQRHCNPLSPQYFYPGETENHNSQNDPYGERNNSMS